MKSNSIKKILVITHDASRSGAPILLLNLLKLLKSERNFEIKIIIKNGVGELFENFKKLGDVCIWDQSISKNLVIRLLKRLFPAILKVSKNNIKIQRWINDSDFVLSNTIANGDILGYFDTRRSIIISYIHELELVGNLLNRKDALKQIDISEHFFVPCSAVQNYLKRVYKISNNSISLLNYYIGEKYPAILANEISEKFFVGIAGTLEWRKGAGIITSILCAYYNKYNNNDIKFIWQGVNMKSVWYQMVQHELKHAGLTDKILFVEPTADMSGFYNIIDIFLLCSLEDSYPLVVLEAAKFKKPSICFENAGGAPEFVEDDCGDIVPYLNIELLAQSIHSYYIDRNKIKNKGENAHAKFKLLHSDKELILGQFDKVIK